MTSPNYRAVLYPKIQTDLGSALDFCESLGLRARVGRFKQYERDVQRVINATACGFANLPDSEIAELEDPRYRVALSEALEFGDMLPYLQICRPEDIRSKLEKVLVGPEMPNEENATSNQARNYQFELLFASILSSAGFPPTLGEHPDVRLRVDRHLFLFECKRLFSLEKLPQRIKEAGEQLRRALKHHPTGAARGIVVLCLSRLMNPEARAFTIENRDHGAAGLAAWLDGVAKSSATHYADLFRREIAVATFFYGASDFTNLQSGKFDRGSFFDIRAFIPPFSSYKTALEMLGEGLKARSHYQAS